MKKLPKQDVPKAWAALHDASASRLLRTEAKNILALRTAARHIHHALLTRLSAATRTSAITATMTARKEMAEVIAKEVRAVRGRAREAALTQARAELALLVHQLHPQDRAQVNADKMAVVDHEADAASADTAGHSLATAWASMVLATLIPAKDEEDNQVSKKSAFAMQTLDSRVKRIGATETAQAYNDQHEDAIEQAVGEPDGTWFGWLFRFWSAVLDRKTCPECRDHDGEIVPIGMRFSGGDEPGDLHPFCRCTDSLVFLPLYASDGKEPNEDPDDDEVEAEGA